ncbi:glutaredoxin domain-containing protein [Cryptosporangium minutisporangium]|uniref:glutaredoxin domain-containing protein n=1 Tax=Cryptosporangium minutisporangium TaxID=113569 RepID=UPI0035E52CBB
MGARTRPPTRLSPPARSAADGRPIVYWRPGCQHCIWLRFRLGLSARRAYWVNIWADPEGAGAVRAAADGTETVPTVYVDGRAFVNPEPDYVRAWVGGRDQRTESA